MNRYRIQFILLSLVCVLSAEVGAVEFAGGTGQAGDPYQIATPAQLIAVGADANLQDKHFVLIADLDMDPNLPDGQLLRSGLILTTGTFDGAGYRVLNLVVKAAHLHTEAASLFESVGSESIVKNLSLGGVSVDSTVGWSTAAMLASRNEGIIMDCLVEGQLSARAGGGLVWENHGLILSCSVAGIVGADDSGGGLAGINTGTIMYSSSTANVTGGAGLVGENSGAIVACWATGDVTDGPAGLVGDNSGTIRHCYATGDVTTSGELAGGLVGTNSGEVSQCYATGDVWAEDRAAGLAAVNEGTIAHCYATGSGGMALATVTYGDDEGIVQSCYALAERDGGGINNGIGIILTDAQMRTQECFIGWDFDGADLDGSGDYWIMPEAGGYPILTTVERPGYVGAGTADDPYLIETCPQLLLICCEPRAHYRLLNSIDLEGQNFSMPIIPAFWGHFDGAGYSVSNFSFTGEEDLGIFGTVHSEAIVTDLTIQRASVMLTSEQSQPESGGIGILAARNRGSVMGCSVSAEAATWSYGIFENIGGLVGINEMGEVSRCSAHVAFSHRYMNRAGSLRDCGGLVGRNTGTIYQCCASTYGNVSFQRAGGLVGTNIGTVYQCRASAYDNDSSGQTGGLIGSNEGDVTDSYADGYLEGSYGIRSPSISYVPVGGLIGTNTGAVTRCYSVTTVLVAPAGTTVALFNGAGLVGENLGGPIETSYFLPETDAGGVDNGFGVALSEPRMRQQASFVGWDFEDTWTICEGQDYPRLRWEGVTCEGP